MQTLVKLRQQFIRWRRALVPLAAIVVFATTYALILPAITMDKQAADSQVGVNTTQNQTKVKAKSGDYQVTATYGKDAQLPDGVKLKVSNVGGSSATYAQAKDAVVAAKKKADKKFESNAMGFKALDISFVDKTGKKVEPKGKVNVKIAIKGLSQEAAESGITVQHIMKKTDMEANRKSSGLLSSSDMPSAHGLVAQGVGGKTSVTANKQGTAEFSVNSFSVFTITWSKGNTDTTRIGNVQVRYVDTKGLEHDVDEGSELTYAEMAKVDGGIVNLSDVANKNGKSRISGYTFDHAAIGSRSGTTVTGLKVETGTSTAQRRVDYDFNTGKYIYTDVTYTSYKLYYTTDDTVNADSKWTRYLDSASSQDGNNAMVFLIYSDIVKPVSIHFVDLNGDAIKGSDGKSIVKTIDAADHTSEYDLVSYVRENLPNGYSFSDTRMNTGDSGRNSIILQDANGSVTIGSIKGTYYRFLKYEDNTVKLARGDRQWHDASDPVNIYVTLTGSTPTPTTEKDIVFHHVDIYGAMLAGDTSQTLPDRSTWDGYSNALNSNDSHYHVNNVGDYGYSYIGYFGETPYLNIKDGTTLNGIYYKHDSDGTWHTGLGTTTSDVSREIMDKDGKAALLNNVYQTYTGKKGLTVHYVDEDGKTIKDDTGNAFDSGATFTAAGHDVNGYTYQGARLSKDADGQAFTSVTYTESDGTWTSETKNGDDTVDTNGVVNEVWLVYKKDVPKQQFTVHYQYQNEDATTHQPHAYYGDNADNKTDTFDVEQGDEKALVNDPLTNGYADIIKDGQVYLSNESGGTGSQQLSYLSTHLGSVDGPEVSGVEVDSKGKITYRNSYSYQLTPSQQSPNRFTVRNDTSAQQGRSFVITRGDDGNLTLEDSEVGTFQLNYANEEGSSSDYPDEKVGASYTATYHGERYTIEYTATVNNNSYGLTVEAYIPSTNTDIYQVYVNPASSNPDTGKIWIKDDMKYSGLFRVVVPDSVTNELGNNGGKATDVKYEWTRIETSTSGAVKEVPLDSSNRKQTGDHWNIAENEANRTYVDIEADEGKNTWKAGTTYSYKVKLTYTYTPTNGTAQQRTYESDPVTVDYYGQLENGGFETPNMKDHPEVFNGGQASNANYKAAGGVWQTTGEGSGTFNNGSTKVGHDIEIYNKNNIGGVAQYWYDKNTDRIRQNMQADTVDGDQFAELNCETAGALYQDVITHPNETLSYWFSHRARTQNLNDKGGKDTMYLVIMPTKLAMTSGDNQTELKTQAQLQKFIEDHGGWDSSVSNTEESKVTYRDNTNGILVRKVTSDNLDWHEVDVTDGYTAKGGLTRFFFVAGPSHISLTEGNFLDHVGFSQSLPTPDGFNMTVSKTFSGLTQAQVAAMATNNSGDKAPYALTITNAYSQDGTSKTNDSLQYAKLRFKATQSGTTSYEFTPTATQWFKRANETSAWEPITENDYNEHHESDPDNYKEENLLAEEGNSGTPLINSDGSVTFTWTFAEQGYPGDGSASGRNYAGNIRYTVKEDNDTVDGYSLSPTYDASTSQWIDFYAGKMDGSDAAGWTFSPDKDHAVTSSADDDVTHTLPSDTNIIISQVHNGASTEYMVWDKDSPASDFSGDQKDAVAEFINSLDWPEEITADASVDSGKNGHVTFSNTTNTDDVQYSSSNTDLTFTYTPADTTVAGSTPSVRFNNTNDHAYNDSDGAGLTLVPGVNASFNFNNDYREKNSSQITVQKTFSGVTQSTVNTLLDEGYKITVTKTHDDAGREISGTKPTIALDQDTANNNSNVTYTPTVDSATGKVTLTWVIREIEPDNVSGANDRMGGPGIYSVSETGFTPTKEQGNGDNNGLKTVTVNGESVDISNLQDTDVTKNLITKTGIYVGKVGNVDHSPTIVKREGTEEHISPNQVDINSTYHLPPSTNFAVGVLNDSSNTRSYLVWTLSPAGANLRQAAINKINSIEGLGTGAGSTPATLANTRFYNTSGVASLMFDSQHPGFSLDCNVVTWGDNPHIDVTFKDDNENDNLRWIGYYSGVFDLQDGQDGSMTINDTEIRVGNSYDPIVKLKKIAQADEGAEEHTLSGAKFRVYKYNNDGDKEYLLSDSTATDVKFGKVSQGNSGSSTNKAKDFTTRASDGMVELGVLPLERDNATRQYKSTDYYLEEVEAPGGYLQVNDIHFVVNADGTVQLIDADGNQNAKVDPAKVSWDDPYYTITVSDIAGYELPNTGGMGDGLIYIVGLALVVMALAGLHFVVRRQRGGGR